ncbi:MAG: RnfABCDGE type electron transport complex subunit D [Clostridia bacterium]|nr:RnfABCDGE type electron transport complex subunit D [Clostridia bacterium]
MAKLHISSSPHISSKRTTQSIMLDVVIALMPLLIAGCIIFGMRSLLVVGASVVASVGSEYIFCLITKKKNTIFDLSAVVTGVIIGLNLPATAPIWQVIVGSVFAIVVVKGLFGGLGQNFANPAATARVFLLICFSGTLAGGVTPKLSSAPDLVAGATPLTVMRDGGELPSLLDMFLGLRGGAIGETCVLAILIGFAYLVIRRVINFEVPLIYVATVFVLSLIADNSFSVALYQVLSGGLMLGAVFMITDYATTPVTREGKMVFAFGCGLITYLIRAYGSYPEGVSFAILLMNILTPYIQKWTAKRPFGGAKV